MLVLYGEVHLLLIVFKNTQSDNLFGEVVGGRLGIAPGNAQKHQQARTNLSYSVAINTYPATSNSLHDGAHRGNIHSTISTEPLKLLGK